MNARNMFFGLLSVILVVSLMGIVPVPSVLADDWTRDPTAAPAGGVSSTQSCGQLAQTNRWPLANCEVNGNNACNGTGPESSDCDHCCKVMISNPYPFTPPTYSTPQVPSKSTSDECTYVVQPNDTLFGLANRKWSTTVEAIKKANGGLPGGLRSGKTIRNPTCDSGPTIGAPMPTFTPSYYSTPSAVTSPTPLKLKKIQVDCNDLPEKEREYCWPGQGTKDGYINVSDPDGLLVGSVVAEDVMTVMQDFLSDLQSRFAKGFPLPCGTFVQDTTANLGSIMSPASTNLCIEGSTPILFVGIAPTSYIGWSPTGTPGIKIEFTDWTMASAMGMHDTLSLGSIRESATLYNLFKSAVKGHFGRPGLDLTPAVVTIGSGLIIAALVLEAPAAAVAGGGYLVVRQVAWAVALR